MSTDVLIEEDDAEDLPPKRPCMRCYQTFQPKEKYHTLCHGCRSKPINLSAREANLERAKPQGGTVPESSR